MNYKLMLKILFPYLHIVDFISVCIYFYDYQMDFNAMLFIINISYAYLLSISFKNKECKFHKR